MFEPKIKVKTELYQLLIKRAETLGYSSVDEYVSHILEKEVAADDQAHTEEQVKKQLKGLGYLG